MRMNRPEGEVPYSDEILRLDEEICRLAGERAHRTGERRAVPDEAQLADWAQRYGIGEPRLRSLFATLAAGSDLNHHPPRPEGLRRVVPLMRRREAQGIAFTLTHCLQYGNASVVHLEVEVQGGASLDHRGRLELSVEAAGYETGGFSGGGAEGRHHFDFVVWPALPDDLSRTTLIVRTSPGEPPRPEPVRLAEPVSFVPGEVS